MMRKIRAFWRDEAAYVVVLTMIAMPLLLGFALLVIDVARGNNLHTDLQNDVDALALAGARELDGGTDAITRANDAIATMVKNQARFSDGGGVIIDASQVSVTYLDAIPASDDDPIDSDWITNHGTTDGTVAAYVMVRSNVRSMTSLFPIPVGFNKDTVNFQAEAVATYDVSACDVTPLFICNPFENDGSGLDFEQSFAAGKTYSRVFTLTFNGGTSIGPGNFGWLQVADPGGDALRDALASGKPGVCYSQNGLTTKTGGTIGPAEQGVNVRLGIYAGAMRNNDVNNRPALNIRKGAKDPNKTSSCGSYEEVTDQTTAMALPSASLATGNTYSAQTLPGGTLSGDNWDLAKYWSINHPGVALPSPFPRVTDPMHSTTGKPSRYDVYRYEIDNNLISGASNTAPNGETGTNACYKGTGVSDSPDRRLVFAAVVNCASTSFTGQTTFTKPAAFVSMFLTKPMIASGSTKTLSAEIVDVTGNSGNGTLETFLREESFLVR